MIITAIFILVLFVQLTKTTSSNRKVLSLVALCLYLTISLFDLFWLEDVMGRSFHLSDPSEYHYSIKGLSLSQVFQIESSNTFYYIINWLYNLTWANTTIISFLVKINNALIAVCTYLLLTKKIEKVTSIDYLLLFNPYTIMTLIRNARDMYIVLFVTIILIAFGVIRNNKLSGYWAILTILLLYITRSVLLLPLFFIYWTMHKEVFSKRTRLIFNLMGIIALVLFFSSIIQTAANQMISAMVRTGENYEDLMPLLKGGVTFGTITILLKRIFIGFISFLFTPHPVNFISKWFESMDSTGTSGIYTGIDNALISLGSIFNYLFVIPVVIAFLLNKNKVNKYIFILVVCYILLYVVSYLGVTDIRNRNTAIFFMLIGVLFSDKPIEIKPLYYIITACIFTGLIFISA